VKADPQAQRRLLDVQAIDTALTQLAHKRKNLPEHAELERMGRDLANLEDERVQAQVAVDDIDRDINRLEKDIEQVRARAAKDRQRLDAGTGPARELEALQHELGSLARRQTELEDSELEFMEQRETAAAILSDLESRRGQLVADRAEVEARRDQLLADIAKDEQWKVQSRGPLVADLPADLIGLYDKVRDASGGLGAALLRFGRCEGCRLELSGSAKSEVRAAARDDVVRCEECRRILVRTEESGL
jgi:predicted  nucleic acid-binding Zn-ribbon protein